MTMSARLGKFVLTTHIAFSVGWLGAVLLFLFLGVVALTSQNPQLVRSTYLVMEPAAWFTLVPLSIGSLVTGLIQSLGTRWGLIRHYWVLFKLLINLFASIVLLMYAKTLELFAVEAAAATAPSAELGVLRSPSVVIHAGGALVLLLVATTLSVYKPKGLTRYGQRRLNEERSHGQRAVSAR